LIYRAKKDVTDLRILHAVLESHPQSLEQWNLVTVLQMLLALGHQGRDRVVVGVYGKELDGVS